MRRFLACALTAMIGLGLAPVAHGDEVPLSAVCPPGPAWEPTTEENNLVNAVSGAMSTFLWESEPRTVAVPLAEQALGGQYGWEWVRFREPGWWIAVAPGPLDLTAARSRLLQFAATRVGPKSMRLLAERVFFVATRYPRLEIDAIVEELDDKLRASHLGVAWTIDAACSGDAFRAEVTLYSDRTAAAEEEARRLISSHGNRAILRLSSDSSAFYRPPRRRVTDPAEFVTAPWGPECIRARSARISLGERGRRERVVVRVRHDGRSRWIEPTTRPRSVVIRLVRRTTHVRVRVDLRRGGSVERSLLLRRCGSPQRP